MKFLILLSLVLCLLCGCATGSVEEVPEQTAAETGENLVMETAERLWPVVFSRTSAEAGFASLTDNQKVFFALNYLDMEVANGGLCQFFANDGGLFSPYISGYLNTVGAVEHQKLFDGFTEEHGIDVRDLSEFTFTSIESFVDLYDLYPFDEFDDAYYELEPLYIFLADFIRANPEDFPN